MNAPLQSCCEFYAAQLPDGCNQGRKCPARCAPEIPDQATFDRIWAKIDASTSSAPTPRDLSAISFLQALGRADRTGGK